MSGLALETATGHVEVLVCDPQGRPLAHRAEDVEHGHTRRVAGLVDEALAEAKVAPRELGWVAADLGPGSFTGVRVGLATARALALVAGAQCRGASSLAVLALGSGLRRAIVVPLVPAGRRDVYAGWFRADARGQVWALAAPEVGPASSVIALTRELSALVPRATVQFLGPGVPREREPLEAAFRGGTRPAWREGGLSAHDLAAAVRRGGGPAVGLPTERDPLEPLYVRPAQAEERVRRRVAAETPIRIREFRADDIPAVGRIEREVFGDPWPESFFAAELASPLAYARIAERGGTLAGYGVAWLGVGTGHLGNLAVVPAERRRGVAGMLLDDLLREVRAQRVESLTLEVRVSNHAAQWLYRRHGFRLVGLRRRYYRDTGEDALVMEWRP